ncbi:MULTISPECIES: nuclease-related domain-containing protein [Streptomyces]|uniref:nuclease-related domain-containing protein n=1 Tax=Streptomyces TaxID=1883 RepID=UPI0016792D19|nr:MULTISPECIES: nuclease-related domain-containing protein [Streptomyces]MBD3576144.1 NERD domain-containing protein [Streptomyces sp. KD18]GGS97391.1 hypothetical protein GCM10010286_22940 [Streptomyces toxytricini]
MGELTVKAWKRYGRDRLYVNAADGGEVAWFDQVSEHLELKRPGLRAEVLKALVRYVPTEGGANGLTAGKVPKMPGSVPPPLASRPQSEPRPTSQVSLPPRPSGPPLLPPLADGDDLARNKPGEALKRKLDTEGPGLAQRWLDVVLRRPSDMDSWRKGLVGERKVGKELRRFLGHGWVVLHSVPLPPKHDIDHLLIGPGGVFTLNTKNFTGRNVWVGDDVVKVDHGPGYPIPKKARREAERAAKVLTAHCGFSVEVAPLLIFVQPAAVDLASPQQTVQVYNDLSLAALAHATGVLDARKVEQIYAVARHRQAWATA